jgi:hypothetical protein
MEHSPKNLQPTSPQALPQTHTSAHLCIRTPPRPPLAVPISFHPGLALRMLSRLPLNTVRAGAGRVPPASPRAGLSMSMRGRAKAASEGEVFWLICALAVSFLSRSEIELSNRLESFVRFSGRAVPNPPLPRTSRDPPGGVPAWLRIHGILYHSHLVGG